MKYGLLLLLAFNVSLLAIGIQKKAKAEQKKPVLESARGIANVTQGQFICAETSGERSNERQSSEGIIPTQQFLQSYCNRSKNWIVTSIQYNRMFVCCIKK